MSVAMSSPKNHHTKKHGTVIALQQTHPEQALEGLNRITGLNFARWPESLAPQPAQQTELPPDADLPAERATGNGTPR